MYITEYIEGKNHFAVVVVNVDDNLHPCVGTKLENFGGIEIKNICTDDEKVDLFYDGISFFLNEPLKEINKAVKEENLYDKKLMKGIKKFLLTMKEKGYLR